MESTSNLPRHDYADTNELRELNALRAAMYGVLSRIFRVEVDQAFLDALKAIQFQVDTESDKYNKGVYLLVEYLSNARESVLTDLAIDYVKAFIGHGIDAYAAAYPYESVYTSPKRLLMQEARDQVLVSYRSAGLDKTADWKEGEDHIALELEFMQILSNRIVSSLQSGDEKEALRLYGEQRQFLKDHLTKWVPFFAEDVIKFSETGFYQGAVFLLEGFIETDLLCINELLDS